MEGSGQWFRLWREDSWPVVTERQLSGSTRASGVTRGRGTKECESFDFRPAVALASARSSTHADCGDSCEHTQITTGSTLWTDPS